MAGAERLVAPRHATAGKTTRERSDRRWRRFASDAPRTSLSTRLCTVARITSAAAVIVSTRGRAVFLRLRSQNLERASARPRRSLGEGGRGDEPKRSPCRTAVASPRCAGEPTLQRCRRRSSLGPSAMEFRCEATIGARCDVRLCRPTRIFGCCAIRWMTSSTRSLHTASGNSAALPHVPFLPRGAPSEASS